MKRLVLSLCLILCSVLPLHAQYNTYYLACSTMARINNQDVLVYSDIFEGNPGQANTTAFKFQQYVESQGYTISEHGEYNCNYDSSIPLVRNMLNSFIHGSGQGNWYMFIGWPSDIPSEERIYSGTQDRRIYGSFQLPDRNK